MDDRGEVIIYQTEDGLTKIDVTMQDETVWLSQADMSKLFQTTKQNVSLHINNIFKDGELDSASVVKECLTTGADGKNYKTKFYNLDVIISVGYRVKSQRGGGYFKELLERIRDIRASEKVSYHQVLEIYATSIDYNPKAEVIAENDFMGLMTFSGDQPTLREVKVAKNYLDEKELRAMGQLVSPDALVWQRDRLSVKSR